MKNLISNSDRLSALTSFVKQYDADIVDLYYSKVKPTTAWFNHVFSECEQSALELHGTLFAMAEKFLSEDNMAELKDRFKLWALNIEVAAEYASDDLSCYKELYTSEHDMFQDTYNMYYNEY
jgi:hypothetical protein